MTTGPMRRVVMLGLPAFAGITLAGGVIATQAAGPVQQGQTPETQAKAKNLAEDAARRKDAENAKKRRKSRKETLESVRVNRYCLGWTFTDFPRPSSASLSEAGGESSSG